MSTTATKVSENSNIEVARNYFDKMFKTYHAGYQNHCYEILGRAYLTLDSQFTICANFFWVVHANTVQGPYKDRQVECAIFSMTKEEDRFSEFKKIKERFYILPTEAAIKILNDKDPFQAIMTFRYLVSRFDDSNFNEITISQYNAESRIVSLTISEVGKKIKGLLDEMNDIFQKTLNSVAEMRDLHQRRVEKEESALVAKNQQDTSDKSADSATLHNLENAAKTTPTKSTKSKLAIPKKSSANSTDNTNSNKECLYCGRKTTPMWRRGPDGPGTLCNACGVKWRHGKILCDGNAAEPKLSSPTTVEKVVDPIVTRGSNPKTKRKSKSIDPSTPAVKRGKGSNSVIKDEVDVTGIKYSDNDNSLGSESLSSSSSASPHSTNLKYYQTKPDKTLIFDDTAYNIPHSLGVDAVEAATVLTLLKRS